MKENAPNFLSIFSDFIHPSVRKFNYEEKITGTFFVLYFIHWLWGGIALQMKLSGKKAHTEMSSCRKKKSFFLPFLLDSFKVGHRKRNRKSLHTERKNYGKLIRIESSFVLFIIIIRVDVSCIVQRGMNCLKIFRISASSFAIAVVIVYSK